MNQTVTRGTSCSFDGTRQLAGLCRGATLRPWHLEGRRHRVARPRSRVFGLEGDQDTRAALRFFKERRTPVSFVDLRKRPIAPGELRRFVERLGAEALLDTAGRAYREAGLAYLRMDGTGIVDRLLANPALLRLPLIRHGGEVSVGRAETTWTAWVKPGARS